MAATSTNKQPLLVDRVLHYVVDLNTAAVGSIDVAGTNTALLIVDGTQKMVQSSKTFMQSHVVHLKQRSIFI